jgi:hypothetical protein
MRVAGVADCRFNGREAEPSRSSQEQAGACLLASRALNDAITAPVCPLASTQVRTSITACQVDSQRLKQKTSPSGAPLAQATQCECQWRHYC